MQVCGLEHVYCYHHFHSSQILSLLPRVAVDAPSLEFSKARLDGALKKMVWRKMSLPLVGGVGT